LRIQPPEVDCQAFFVVQVKNEPVLFGQPAAAGEQNLAAHAQVQQQPALARLHLEPFAVGLHAQDPGAGQGRGELVHRHVQALRLEHLDAGDGAADQVFFHVIGEYGDLG